MAVQVLQTLTGARILDLDSAVLRLYKAMRAGSGRGRPPGRRRDPIA